jgi:hypothetical protein
MPRSQSTYNVDGMMVVRNYISEHPDVHDQLTWYDEDIMTCGTVACIAGHTVLLLGSPQERQDLAKYADSIHTVPVAAEHLGLSWHEAGLLFHMLDEDSALRVLDEMIEAGKNGERITESKLQELVLAGEEAYASAN